jgi:hypothetical protein
MFKKLLILSTLFWGFLIGNGAQAQDDATGLPGDQFSLEGALEMFKKAKNPEDFEKLINEEGNKVNNLDLNEDGETDYIFVNEHQEGNTRVFVLSVAVSDKENQDIATLELEKTGDENAVAQIIGNEEIFGEETILEPADENDPEPMKEDTKGHGPNAVMEDDAIVVNVWFWPCVRFIYGPGYRPWVSPWRWRVYPAWWRPWRPHPWSVWRPYRMAYRGPGVRVVHVHRIAGGHRVYAPVRRTSVTVKTRYAPAHKSYQVKRTKVTGPRGNTRTKTTVRGPKGNVKASKTTVRKGRR